MERYGDAGLAVWLDRLAGMKTWGKRIMRNAIMNFILLLFEISISVLNYEKENYGRACVYAVFAGYTLCKLMM